jgi:hypothetical protein
MSMSPGRDPRAVPVGALSLSWWLRREHTFHLCLVSEEEYVQGES